MRGLRNIIFCLLLSFSLFSTIRAQEDSTLSKGRFTSSLYGFMQSTQLTSNISAYKENTNSYIISTKTGVFFADRWAGGLSLTLIRTETENTDYRFNDEQFLLGVWTRWFFLKYKDVGMYADLNPYMIAVDQMLNSKDSLDLNVDSKGLGLGISPGLGFVYFINQTIGFSMHLDYFFSFIPSTKNDGFSNVAFKEDLEINQLRFSFGFQIYLDQFFF